MCTGHASRANSAAPHAAVLRDAFVEQLQKEGYLNTAQRHAVVEAIVQIDGHICAQHVLDSIKRVHPELRVNKTTVYRTLDILLALGLITEMKCGESRAQYEIAARGPHYHLVCERCGTVEQADADLVVDLERSLLKRYGFELDLRSRPLFGVCRLCR